MEASVCEKKARDLAGKIEIPGKDAKFFRGILKLLVQEMGSLQLGTIDSFFARIVGSFPYELGLTRPHRIMDEVERSMARRLAMEHLLQAGDKERENRILQLYKQLTWGFEGKNVYSTFEDHLREFHDLFLENRDPSIWGSEAALNQSDPWWDGPEEDLPKLLTEIRKEVSTLGLKSSMDNAFQALLEALQNWQPGSDLPTLSLWNSLMGVRKDLLKGSAEISYRRIPLEIKPPLSDMLYRLLQVFVRREIRRQVRITHSIGQLLHEYDAFYDDSVRESGSLVFADFPMLLVKGLCGDTPSLAAQEILYRLDGQTDHWMIDEFQDTSRIQWNVLSTFTDEILQDPSGERSFFYVGDVKQSIYGWRGGDSRLFQEIFKFYNRSSTVIEDRILNESRRSVPAVLDSVNALFGEGLSEELIGESVKKRWSISWAPHIPSPQTAQLDGYAGWGLVEDKESLPLSCIDLIQKLEPLEKGLSCAILVRTNAEVVSMAQALREAGILASMEGVVRVARDNVVGSWIISFLYSLARPGEDFPRAFLELPGIPMSDKEYRRLAGLIRTVLTIDGYAEAVRRLLGYLQPLIAPVPFLSRRSEQLLEAATRFESTGMEGLESFIRYLEEITIKEASLSKQIQVMTVHKAKGLGFDIVIAAGFGATPLIGQNRDSLHVHRGETGNISWIFDFPKKAVYEQDPFLNSAYKEYEDDQTFEALCLLYVAMTRAKRGLYCLASKPGRQLKALTWQKLFESATGKGSKPREDGRVEWQMEWGNPEWSDAVTAEPVPDRRGLQLDALKGSLPKIRPTLKNLPSPSQEAHGKSLAPRKLRSNGGRQFGTRMHDFLSTIEWVDFDDPSAIDQLLSGVAGDLKERLLKLLCSAPGKEIFTKPGTAHQLWREKPYVLRRDDRVAQGIIDRAIVHLDGAGKAERVVIYDYKTDSLDPGRSAEEQLLERYSTQLDRYREAVCALTGLPGSAITTRLIPV
jgi:ATP-dependent exoDNAse (exonuclease V) beta subunit